MCHIWLLYKQTCYNGITSNYSALIKINGEHIILYNSQVLKMRGAVGEWERPLQTGWIESVICTMQPIFNAIYFLWEMVVEDFTPAPNIYLKVASVHFWLLETCFEMSQTCVWQWVWKWETFYSYWALYFRGHAINLSETSKMMEEQKGWSSQLQGLHQCSHLFLFKDQGHIINLLLRCNYWH